MRETRRVLLDQNVPELIAPWLASVRPSWTVQHVRHVGLKGRPDREIYGWAQADGSVIVTYDDDFADQRSYPLGSHHGIVRLRVWPTTIEETRAALERLLDEVDEATLREALVVVGRRRIRVRRPDQPSSGRA